MPIANPDQICCLPTALSPISRCLMLAADRAQFHGDVATCIDLIDAFYASLERPLSCEDDEALHHAARFENYDVARIISTLLALPVDHPQASTG